MAENKHKPTDASVDTYIAGIVKYDSGREGDTCLVGFASREGDISLYLSSDYPKRDARAR